MPEKVMAVFLVFHNISLGVEEVSGDGNHRGRLSDQGDHEESTFRRKSFYLLRKPDSPYKVPFVLTWEG
jgi:hypothetical protein